MKAFDKFRSELKTPKDFLKNTTTKTNQFNVVFKCGTLGRHLSTYVDNLIIEVINRNVLVLSNQYTLNRKGEYEVKSEATEVKEFFSTFPVSHLKLPTEQQCLAMFPDGYLAFVEEVLCNGDILVVNDLEEYKIIPKDDFKYEDINFGYLAIASCFSSYKIDVKQENLPDTSKEQEHLESAEGGNLIPLYQEYNYITEGSILFKKLGKLPSSVPVGLDLETTGLDPWVDKTRLISVSVDSYPTLLIDCFQVKDLSCLQDFLNKAKVIVGQNLKFDLKFLKRLGVQINNRIFDCQAASYLIGGGVTTGNSLAEQVSRNLDLNLDKSEQKSDWSQETLTRSQLHYAALDSQIVLNLRNTYLPLLSKGDRNLIKAASIEFECVKASAEMELNGIAVNRKAWQNLNLSIEQDLNRLEIECNELFYLDSPLDIKYPINLDSPKQLKECLQGKGIKVDSTDVKTLGKLAKKHPEIRKLMEYRNKSKLYNSFTSVYEKKLNVVTGKLHPTFKQFGTEAGRFSCSDPNIQQLPRSPEVRECFIPEPGTKFVIADYSQIELRIAAHISCDERMLKAYRNNEDLHKLTASLVLDKAIEEVSKSDRQIAKSLNFGLLYGMGSKSLKDYASVNFGVELSEKEAEKFRDKFFEVYKGLSNWHKETKKLTGKASKTLTLSGRFRYVEANIFTNRLNTPVQGTGADILKMALVALHKNFQGTEVKLIACIHDEIILQAPKDLAEETGKILSSLMEKAGEEFIHNVPIIAEYKVCDSWAEK